MNLYMGHGLMGRGGDGSWVEREKGGEETDKGSGEMDHGEMDHG
jgi:hypothetical protein